ncbi:hypothetical protein DFJ74DRAFT_691214 [Hyaloraphidium curvatum]|nr:hypothetical protein DFJ74DRAFT_691214 [Hyaloraphidium curvatum]
MATLGGSTMSGALAGGAPLKPRIKSSQILVSSSAPLLPPSATNGAVVGRGVRSTDAGLVCPACLAHNPAGVPGCLACGSAFALPLPAPERPKSRGANSQSGDSIARAKSSGTGFSDRAGATLPPGFGAAVPTGSRSGGIAGGMKTLPPGIGLPGMPSPNVGAVQAQQAQQQAQQAQGQPPGGYAQPQPQYAAYQQQMQGYPQMQMQMGMQGGYYGQQLQAGQQAGRY